MHDSQGLGVVDELLRNGTEMSILKTTSLERRRGGNKASQGKAISWSQARAEAEIMTQRRKRRKEIDTYFVEEGQPAI